jgi:hypothetical protein
VEVFFLALFSLVVMTAAHRAFRKSLE